MNSNILYATVIFIAFILLSILIAKALKKIATHYDASASESFKLISNSQRAVLIFIGTALSLSKLGFDISALVAGLGITGAAIGFALRDAIANLVAGLMIVIYKPVELGNVIEVSEVKGVVIDVNLRYLTIKADDEITHLVPNALLIKEKVTVFSEQLES